MKFRISIYCSLCAHVVALGSALAFAQFSGRTAPFGPQGIMVSLVSPPAGSAAKIAPLQHRYNQPASEQHHTMEQPAFRPADAPELPAVVPKPPQRSGTAAEDGDATKREQNDDSGDGPKENPAPADAGIQSSGAGSVDPGQWALIKAAIERSKRYPRFARERGIGGEVRLRFRLASSGGVDAVEIIKSSGSDILDRESVRALYRAAPMPYVEGWIEVPIMYVIK